MPRRMFGPSPVEDEDGRSQECPTRWPFLDKYDFKDAVPDDETIEKYIGRTWKEILAILAGGDQCALLKRPPNEADQNPQEHPTVHYALPIQLDTGTTSYEDTLKRLNHARKHCLAKYLIEVGKLTP